jgi:hypothetical protein
MVFISHQPSTPLEGFGNAARKTAHPPLGRPFQYSYEFGLPGI